MDFKCLEMIRLSELDGVLSILKKRKNEGSKILEIGAGTGYQAKKLHESGYLVEAIDIEDCSYLEHAIWPVSLYDGQRIPFPDNYFDVVFSSNVLEHIPHLIEFQAEIQRVLKTDGIALHVLPTGTWRFWATASYHVFLLKKMIARNSRPVQTDMVDEDMVRTQSHLDSYSSQSYQSPLFNLIRKLKLFISLPPRHGEIGNVFSEMYYFSKRRWVSMFVSTGWQIETIASNQLFYTGNMIVGSAFSIEIRKLLSRILGNSCHIFVTKTP